MFGMLKQLLGGAFLRNDTVADKQHTAGYLTGKAHFMGNDHHGHAAFCQLFHNVKHLAHKLRVKGRGGLVKEHNFGFHCQGAGNGNSLLLTAGESGGVGVCLIGKPNHFQQFLCIRHNVLFDFLFRRERSGDDFVCFFAKNGKNCLHNSLYFGISTLFVGMVKGCHGDVFQHRFVSKQVELLKHHTNMFPMDIDIHLHICQVFAFKLNATAGGILKTVDATQKGRLTAAGGADDRNDLPSLMVVEIPRSTWLFPKLFSKFVILITLL